MARRSRFGFRAILVLLVFVVAVFLTRALWLPWLAYPLVRDDGPAKADIAVVLAGDATGRRIEKGAALVREGYVPMVLVSGPPIYGRPESDLAIELAVRNGNPPNWFISLPHSAPSTKEEAVIILNELRRRNVHTFLLVTSNYHSARATRIFRSAEKEFADAPQMRVVAAEDQYFSPRTWWRNREAEKLFFTEWCKVLANAVGL